MSNGASEPTTEVVSDPVAQTVSGSRVINASAEEIFNVLADPRQHHKFDGSDSVRDAMRGPERLSMGAKFGMKMSLKGFPYLIRSTVKEFEENKRIAWAHFGGHRWRYELEPVEGGTRVTETFDYSTAMSSKAIELAGYPKWHKGNIERTLEQLAEYVG